MNTFETLLQNTINNDSTILSAKVISDVHANNGKPYILVDARKKKDYMIYTEEFDTIPAKNSMIDIIIVNNNNEPYGLASYKQAIQMSRNTAITQLLNSKDTWVAIVKAKHKFGYEIMLNKLSEENQNLLGDMKLIYLTKREYKINSEVTVKFKNINNNSIYFKFNNGVISYTNMFKVGQVVKCRVQAIINIVLSVGIINDKGEILNHDNVSCIIPLTDNNENEHKIGDEFNAQIIALSPLRIVLSKMDENDQISFNLLQHISKGQILTAKILSINTNVILLETVINGNIIKCEMSTSEMAWSVIQRESMKNSVWFVGNTIKVQIINFDMRNGRLQVSYKYNLPNPINAFKNEINPLTNEGWKINDIIVAKPTFNASLNNQQFCYLNYNNIDIILHDWLEDEENVKKINKGEPVEVVITSISEEQNSFKIVVSYINTPKRHFQELINKFEYKGTYKCEIMSVVKGDYTLKPLYHITENGEVPIELQDNNYSYFVIKYTDIPSNMRLREGEVIVCKLIYIDYVRKQLKFSINAHNNDKNRQVENTHRVVNSYSIGNITF